MSRILMIVTNHTMINDEPRTGIWFSEFAEPFELFVGARHEVTVASPLGGPAPVDPRGYPSRENIADARESLARLNATLLLRHMKPSDFDAVFLPGGHGPMFDLAVDPTLKALIAEFWTAGKVVGSVCHGPAGLLDVGLPDGSTLLQGRRVTAFSHAEDREDALFSHMPFSLQDRISAEGAHFVEGPAHLSHVEVDGRLVTGQNPQSGRVTAEAFLKTLRAQGS